MLKQVLFSLALMLSMVALQAQDITTVGIIGPATAGGWDEDTDMTQDDTDPAVWTASLTLTTGEAKFRANDDWTINWGSTDFPMGIGESGGANIPVVGGQYDITFNSETGEYSFVSTAPVYTSVGLIGDATPGGWDADTDMVQDAENPNLWSLEVTLLDGEVKFRADDDWGVNWGATDFPIGVGVQDGDNIPVLAGEYTVTFNSASGEYSFGFPIPEYASIGIIGPATPEGWDADTDMTQDPETPFIWTATLQLATGAAKFRADDAWDVNWGAEEFPMGVGTQGGANIPVVAGEYNITFNHVTGEYSFESTSPVYTSVGIIGSATPGGWDADTDMIQSPDNPNLWSLNIELIDGDAKFRANDDWAVNWGATDFPAGVGTQDGDNIPVVAGEYNITFNSATGDYEFGNPLAIYNSVGIIGSGTGTGWDADINMVQRPAQPDQWFVEIGLADGEMKFRADDDWGVNWGDDSFPTGTATQDGPNIPTFAGSWIIDFNATTGIYSFTPTSVGIIGSATPGGWDADTDMSASALDPFTWNITLELVDGEAKFRRDDAWTINWGGAEAITGVGTQDGPNIPVTAGTYAVSFNTLTGEYVLSEPSSTYEYINPSAVSLYPNPTSDFLTVEVEAIELQKDVNVNVFDAMGKLVKSNTYNSMQQLTIDVSDLAAGMYFLQLATEKHLIGKRFQVTK